MPTGPFFQKDPIGLTLAADQRFGPLDPALDAVWQLSLSPGKALALETSFGLQAQKFSVFPIFLVNRRPVWTIGDFFSQPRVDEIFSNYASLTCTPAAGFQARYEVWAEDSTSLLCRMSLQNLSDTKATLGVQAATELFPLQGIAGMAPALLQFQPYLSGRTGGLFIAMAASGKATPVYSPFSALQSEQEVISGDSLAFTWRCSIALDEQTSLKGAYQPFPENWDAAIARLKLTQQADFLEINTPYSDWDMVFLSCQNAAWQALIRSEDVPDQFNFCLHRSPDYSYTQHRNAAKPNLPLEPKLSTLALAQLCQALLPLHAHEAAALLLAQLPALHEPPTLPGSGRKVLPFPCLTQLAVQIYIQSSDTDFLAQIYPAIKETCLAWFEPSHDRDQDGLPEWSTLAQTGWVDHPTFNFFNPEGFSTQIATTESLALGQLLLDELLALQKLARAMEDQPTIERAAVLQSRLASHLEALRAQHPEASCWDRDSHQVTSLAMSFEGSLAEMQQYRLHLAPAARVNAKLLVPPLTPKPNHVQITGKDQSNRLITETITSANLWRVGEFLFFTSEQVYQQIEHVVIPGLSDQTWLRVYVADLGVRDIGSYLAYMPGEELEASVQREATEEEQTAGQASPTSVAFSVGLYGLPDFEQKIGETITAGPVNPAWNSLLLRHLLEVGAKSEAAELFASLMRGTIQVLKQEHSFYDAYNSQSTLPLGKSNSIIGLLPLQTFLELAGIRLLAPDRVQVAGEFPFLWRLSLRYRGLEVVREGKNTTVTLPDGSEHHHFGSQPRMFFTQPSTESADNQVEDKDQ